MHSGYFAREYYFVASNEHAAEVIGSSGWKIKAIARKTQTQIKCPSPIDTPIFCISGYKNNVNAAKKMIQYWADHFDNMKKKKRNIEVDPGDIIETVMFRSLDVSCIIGRRGEQVRKITNVSNVKIISPDVNKEPIFIISGKEHNVKMAILWMKLTSFCSSGTIYFNQDDMLIIERLMRTSRDAWARKTREIINFRKLNEKIYLLSNRSNYFQAEFSKKKNCNPYNCCYCKKQKYRVAQGLCGHIISCDSCVAELFRDIYLRCHFCKLKIENFLINFY